MVCEYVGDDVILAGVGELATEGQMLGTVLIVVGIPVRVGALLGIGSKDGKAVTLGDLVAVGRNVVGFTVGKIEELTLGEMLGDSDGLCDGPPRNGIIVGKMVLTPLGTMVGLERGLTDGADVSKEEDGVTVGATDPVLGLKVKIMLGVTDGNDVWLLRVGCTVGISVPKPHGAIVVVMLGATDGSIEDSVTG